MNTKLLKDILYEIIKQIDENNLGLPVGWLMEMADKLEESLPDFKTT